jgi:phage terminase large subunit-like protein
VVEFPTNQRGRMGFAVSRFTSAVLTGGLAHDGDPRLACHIGHAVARETAEGVLLGKDSKASPRRIDAAIAGVIAHERANWHATSPSAEVMFAWT